MIRTFLDIRSVHVLSGDGQTADFRRVHCPAYGRNVALDQCLSCPESGGIVCDPVDRVEYASCRHAGAEAEAEARREAVGGVLDHTPLSAVMTTDVFAVRPDLSLEALAELLLERGIGGAPVVDEEGRPIGVVSKTDLVGQRFATGEAGGPAARRGARLGPGVHGEASYDSVADAMTRAPFTLPESAPLAEAAALMTTRGVHRVLVVADDGRLSGIVTTKDIVQWVARRTGELHAAP